MARQFLSGNEAFAYGVRLARPQVISAYPITPQTIVVEKLSEFVEDGSFLRLSSLSLSWNVPIKRNNYVNGVLLTFTGRNLFTITNYTGYDPDVNSFTNDSKRIGIDYGSSPVNRSYSLSVNISF